MITCMKNVNNIQDPLKHLRWSLQLKQLTTENCYVFLQKAPSYMYDRVLNTSLVCSVSIQRKIN